MRKAAILALLLAAPARSVTLNLVESSTAALRGAEPSSGLRWSLTAGPRGGARGASQIGVGVGVRLRESPGLQAALWGGAGAVAGSLGGPAGAAIGGAAGALVGLIASKLGAGGEKQKTGR